MQRVSAAVVASFFLVSASVANAQSPGTGAKQGCQPACDRTKSDTDFQQDPKLAKASPNNPHLRAGAQFGYKLAGSNSVDDVSDFFALRTEVSFSDPTTVPKEKGWQMPVIGNFGQINFGNPIDAVGKVNELVNGASGLQVTLSPYYSWSNKSVFERVLVFSNLGGKFNRQKASTDTSRYIWISQLRTSAGIDLSVDVKQTRPISLIVEAVYGYIGSQKAQTVLGRSESYLASLETTGIFPLPSVDNLSLIAQAVSIRKAPALWRVGTLIYAPQKKEK